MLGVLLSMIRYFVNQMKTIIVSNI